MKTVSLSLLLLVSILFSGCAGGPGFAGPVAAPNDRAVVYIYVIHSGMIPRPAQDIYVNGAKIARVPPGGYYIYHADPGELLFNDQAETPTGDARTKALRHKSILALSVQRGQVYFIERVFVMGFPKGMGSFLLRDRASALETLSESIEVGGATAVVASVAPTAPAATAPEAAAPAPVPVVVEKPVEKADVVRAMQTVVPKKHYDSIMTEDCDVAAGTAEEKAEVDSLIAFLKEQKENRDYDQIAKIQFISESSAKVGFIWYSGKHVGSLTVVKEAGTWKITSEAHSL